MKFLRTGLILRNIWIFAGLPVRVRFSEAIGIEKWWLKISISFFIYVLILWYLQKNIHKDYLIKK